MNALDYISIQGFKSINSLNRFEIRGLNIMIGANGAGKSNLISAFAFLQAIVDGKLREHVARAGGAESILHFGSKATPEMRFELSFGGNENLYDLKLGADDKDQLFPTQEIVSFWDKPKYNRPYSTTMSGIGNGEAAISQSGISGIGSWIQHRMHKWRLYHFHDTSATAPMKKNANINDNNFLRGDASNLAAFLYLLQNRHQEVYRRIANTIRLVAPFFKDFQLKPNNLNPEIIRLEWQHRYSDSYFDANSFSDGTLRFIALTTLFLQPEIYRPSVILVDEPELGLHPYAIQMLAELIKQASKETQILISTQSPLLLDYVEPEDVIVCDLIDGKSAFRRVESDSLGEWVDTYSLGQMWEKNEIGGRPN